MRYWKLIRLDAAGGVKSEDIQEAREFFQQQFPEAENDEPHGSARIHRQLFVLSRFEGSSVAQLCLRCFISHQIYQVCRQIAAQYDLDGNLLFPFVLDDTPDRSFPSPSGYRSLAGKILETFDPDRSSLATWTVRLVKRHPELNGFLLQHGIYQISDWAILNDTKPQQLQRIFLNFYHLTALEIQESCQLLESYHQVYRTQRLQKRQEEKSIGQCLPPTDRQLEQMCQYLQKSHLKIRSSLGVLNGLQNVAKRLRDYRIYARSGRLSTQPLDRPTVQKEIEKHRYENFTENETQDRIQKEQFIEAYDHFFQTSLDRAIEQVIQIRIKQKTRRKVATTPVEIASAFHLFYCDGKSQREIAQELGMNSQDGVAKMLNLKSFRADIRQKMLISLLKNVLDRAKILLDPDRLVAVESQVELALEEQIEMAIPESGKPKKTVFTRRLCFYLSQILKDE
ncbi:MAG: hypothetical protein WBG66_19445 [Geitlerinemataceae cyanobacterium]